MQSRTLYPIMKTFFSRPAAAAVVMAVSLVTAPLAGAVTFLASIEDTDWQLNSSKFECRLSQAIPNFGIAAFEHRAGESLEFVLQSAQAVLLGEETRLIAESPPWRPGTPPQQIGTLKVSSQSQVKVRHELANAMLASLYSGQVPSFNNDSWHGSREPVKVAISSVNFQSAYDSYRGCVAGLLPVNYRQIARSAVLFPSAQWRLSDATKKRLELIALYVKNDTSVNAVYVDGHSDNMGRRLANRDLSRKRAEEVSRYLTALGINDEIVTTRYHGERYPVVQNTGADNRARNRRVTIRLEREDQLAASG